MALEFSPFGLRHVFGRCPFEATKGAFLVRSGGRSGARLTPYVMRRTYLASGTTLATVVLDKSPLPVEATMKSTTLARSLLAGLAIIATPLHAQDVSGQVVVRGGLVAGRVVIGDQYSSYRPARRVMVERYAPRVIRVERLRHHHGKHWKRGKHWQQHAGYRRTVVYYVDGRYYDRADRHHAR